jgi:hypothetical protein
MSNFLEVANSVLLFRLNSLLIDTKIVKCIGVDIPQKEDTAYSPNRKSSKDIPSFTQGKATAKAIYLEFLQKYAIKL